MKWVALFFIVVLLASWVTHNDDTRLQGVWYFNAGATVNAMKMSDVPAKHAKQFTDLLSGGWCVSYSNSVATSHLLGEVRFFHYQVVKRGSDYDILRYDAPEYKGRDMRIHFAEGGKCYWLDSQWGIEERFDKVTMKPTKLGCLITGTDRIVARNTDGDSRFDFIISGNTARNLVADVSIMQPGPIQTDSIWDWELKFYKGTHFLTAINVCPGTFIFENEEYFGDMGELRALCLTMTEESR